MWHPPAVTSLADALATIGDRWTLLIVDALLDGSRRFGELEQAVGGISTNVLAQRLRRLEAEGLVTATPYSRRPLRMQYDLTADGRALGPAITTLVAWAAQRSGGDHAVHDACGTPLEVRAWCPTCERTVDPDHVDLHFA